MKELTAESLMEEMSGAAVKIHRDRGELAPAIAFWHETAGLQAHLMLSSDASYDMPQSTFMVGLVMCSVLKPTPTWVVLNVEGWSRPADPNIEELAGERMPKGYLKGRHDAGDIHVHTVIMTHVAGTKGGLDVRIVDADLGYTLKTEGDDHGGALPDAFANIVSNLDESKAKCPDDYEIRDALEFLAPFVEVAMIPDDGGPGQRLVPDDAG